MIAAKESAVLFEAVTDDPNPTSIAGGRQGLNRTLEAVERVCTAVHRDLE